MFDWVLNTSLQTDTLVNIRKEKIGSLQSTRYNEVRNRINKDKVNKVGPTQNLLQCENIIRKSKEAYNRAKEKKTGSSPEFLTYTGFQEKLGYRDVMKISQF